MSEVSSVVQREILQQRLQLWENTLFANECDIKLAKIIEDEKMKEIATAEAKKCIRAIEALKKMIGDLEKPVD